MVWTLRVRHRLFAGKKAALAKEAKPFGTICICTIRKTDCKERRFMIKYNRIIHHKIPEIRKEEHTLGRHRKGGLNFGRRKKKVNMAAIKGVFGWIIEILIVLMLAFTFVYFIGLRTSMVGQSMTETLEGGDEILVNRFIYKVTDPQPGDIIVFLPNGNEKSHYYIKRVIGVPGDTVQIKNGAVYVNGTLFEEETEVASMEEAGLAAEEITLKEDEFFVLGDNRNNSEDSRYANIGNIKKEYIIGKAWFRVAPWSTFGFL